MQRHLGGDIPLALHQEVGRTHTALIVPKGCSTVSRRVRMASGLESSRLWTSSTTCSCSQPVMRRPFDGVHWLLIAQRWHAAVDQ